MTLKLMQGKSVQEYEDACAEAGVPRRMAAGFHVFVEHRALPGDFLYAVLTNNLREAFARADMENERCMKQLVTFCYWCLPAQCWGSKEKVCAWTAEGA